MHENISEWTIRFRFQVLLVLIAVQGIFNPTRHRATALRLRWIRAANKHIDSARFRSCKSPPERREKCFKAKTWVDVTPMIAMIEWIEIQTSRWNERALIFFSLIFDKVIAGCYQLSEWDPWRRQFGGKETFRRSCKSVAFLPSLSTLSFFSVRLNNSRYQVPLVHFSPPLH